MNIISNNSAGLIVHSPAFSQNGQIPSRYTCEGLNINPPLEVTGTPHGTKSLALIMEDPDAVNGTFTHWLLWNIRPGEAIEENSLRGTSGSNSMGLAGYSGPCPPSGSHRYYFKVYALDKGLDLGAGDDKGELLNAMKGHILATGELMGRYQKKKMAAQ